MAWYDAVVSGLSSITDNLFSQYNTRRAQNHAFQLGERAAENAYQRQLDFWNKQNEYNDPTSSYGRLVAGLEANGLNKAMALGSSATPNQAGSLSSVPQNSGVSTAIPQQFPVMQNLIAASMIRRNDAAAAKDEAQVGKTKIETENLTEQQNLIRSQVVLNGIMGDNMKLKNEYQEMVNSVYERTEEATVSQAFTKANQELEILDKYRKENRLLDWQIFSQPDKLQQVRLQNNVLGSQICLNLVTALLRQHQIYLTDQQAEMVKQLGKLYVEQQFTENQRGLHFWRMNQLENLTFNTDVEYNTLRKEWQRMTNEWMDKYKGAVTIVGMVRDLGPLMLGLGQAFGRRSGGGFSSPGGSISPDGMFPDFGNLMTY